jgi:ubiquinone biosynthesis protein
MRRVVPPEGRLGAGDYPVQRLRATLVTLGPVFSGFGRYLATRPDLLPRRHCAELALIPDAAAPADPRAVDALVHRQLGAPPARQFFRFDHAARDVTLWTERHDVWVGPDLPAVVTIVRPDASEWLESDLPLLPLLAGCLEIEPSLFLRAIEDFAETLRARLDQTQQVAAFTALVADAPAVAGFHAPACFRDHCSSDVLTSERHEGATLEDLLSRADVAPDVRLDVARRFSATWIRQVLGGRVVPFDFAPRDIAVDGDRFVVTAAVCEPQSATERGRFSRYLNAVAADDPDAAAAWLLDAANADEVPEALEEELKRRFRQAVPFRDGEWSGDERFAEYVLVQWRAACEAGWRLTPHHVHLYRGVHALASAAQALAPDHDALLDALLDARLLLGASEAAQAIEPAALTERLETALREMVALPQKLDEVLTLAAEGRLRVKLQVPESGERRRAKAQTVMLVANLVLLAAIATLVRHIVPAYGPTVERLAVLVLLVVGGWLLVAAAKI